MSKLNLEPARVTTRGGKKNIVLTEAGRAPWYRTDGTALDCFIVGIAGGSASGKTSVAQEIIRQLNVPWVLVVSQDSFYKSLTKEQSEKAFRNEYDFDCPDAFDYPVLKQCISDLKACQAVQIPIYSFVQHQRLKESQYLYGAAVIIVEGIFVLHDPKIRELLDLKAFVQCDPDLMLARRIKRDLLERGRDVQGVLDQYLRFVKPSFDDYILPTSKHADIIVPGGNNTVAIDLITTHIRRQLSERSLRLRTELSKTPAPLSNAVSETSYFGLPPNVVLMEQTRQLKGIHTILRDVTTPMIEFVFFADRLAALVLEHALQLLPFKHQDIRTRTGVPYVGKVLDAQSLCGVSVLRSGGCLEKGLRRVIRDVALGSMLIQSDNVTGEPLLYNLNLPASVKDCKTSSSSHVLLLDSQIGTGASALMAIRVILDHGVPEENIIMVCFLVSSRGGFHAICRAFPRVRIVTTACDEELEERWITRLPGTEEGDDNKRRVSTLKIEVPPGLTRKKVEESAAARPTTDGNSAPARRRRRSRTDTYSTPSPQLASPPMGPQFVDEEDDDADIPQSPELFSVPKHISTGPHGAERKKVFAILPGMGSFGDRYYGT